MTSFATRETIRRQVLECIELEYNQQRRPSATGLISPGLNDCLSRCPPMLGTPQRQADRERNDRLMATLNQLNQKMGRGTVTLGRPSPKAAWHLRYANRTPRQTVRWEELHKVGAQP